jgi:hypothetical protein
MPDKWPSEYYEPCTECHEYPCYCIQDEFEADNSEPEDIVDDDPARPEKEPQQREWVLWLHVLVVEDSCGNLSKTGHGRFQRRNVPAVGNR